MGDTAQLPPVGEEESPALNKELLQNYGLKVAEVTLTEVVRQSAKSGVLAGATRLREYLSQGAELLPRITASRHGEVRFLPGNELIEALESAYSDCGTQDTIVVTRSNKRANIYNNGIRARIFDREELLTRGDIVMAVKIIIIGPCWRQRKTGRRPKCFADRQPLFLHRQRRYSRGGAVEECS